MLFALVARKHASDILRVRALRALLGASYIPTKGIVMKSSRSTWAAVIALLAMASATRAVAQEIRQPGPAEQILEKSAREQKYSFLVFHKTNDQATQAMAESVQRFVESAPDRSTLAYVDVANPAEASLVKRLDVGRAPMPLVIAIAPNGAVTGATPKKVTEQQLAQAFVTPAMAQCMKAMQSGRLALLCAVGDGPATLSTVAQALMADPQFKDRTEIVLCQVTDRAENELLKELKVEGVGDVVLFAPPGVLVGKFSSRATKNEVAAALHQAGKCCDDPNCKHGQGSVAPGASASRTNSQSAIPARN